VLSDWQLRAVDDDRLVDRVVGLIENPTVSVDLPLDIRGTPFQPKVWAALRASIRRNSFSLSGQIRVCHSIEAPREG
jgi:hypothetical protein